MLHFRASKWWFFLSLALIVVGLGVFTFRSQLFPVSQGDNNVEATPTPVPRTSVEIAVMAPFTYAGQEISLVELQQPNLRLSQKLAAVLDEQSTEDLLQVLERTELPAVFAEAELVQLNQVQYKDVRLLGLPSEIIASVKLLKFAGKNLLRDGDYPLTVGLQGAVGIDLGAVKRVFFGGEIIPARAVDRLFLNKYDNYTLLFDRIRSEIETADLAAAILENPLSGNPSPCTGCTTFVADVRNAAGLAEVGIDVLGFGNHTSDGGQTALRNTEAALTAAGIDYTGASADNMAAAEKLVVREVAPGFKMGFLSFDDVAYFAWAGADKWGTNRFSKAGSRGGDIDRERIQTVVGAAAQKVDFLVILASWGTEYKDTANPWQREMAKAFSAAGADLLVASHPHWVQNFEMVDGMPVFYSLGNFIFDQTHTDPTRQGLWVNTYFIDGKLSQFEIIPHLTCGYHQTSRNLAPDIISGGMSYADVDKISEKQGCVYWQPKAVAVGTPVYQQIWDRFTKSTKILP